VFFAFMTVSSSLFSFLDDRNSSGGVSFSGKTPRKYSTTRKTTFFVPAEALLFRVPRSTEGLDQIFCPSLRPSRREVPPPLAFSLEITDGRFRARGQHSLGPSPPPSPIYFRWGFLSRTGRQAFLLEVRAGPPCTTNGLAPRRFTFIIGGPRCSCP